jgi:hypothetical protein
MNHNPAHSNRLHHTGADVMNAKQHVVPTHDQSSHRGRHRKWKAESPNFTVFRFVQTWHVRGAVPARNWVNREAVTSAPGSGRPHSSVSARSWIRPWLLPTSGYWDLERFELAMR